jgi:hypothetical protein
LGSEDAHFVVFGGDVGLLIEKHSDGGSMALARRQV